MAAQVISLSIRRVASAPVRPQDWSQREIAEFYRVEAALVQAGMRLESERGISDEGDPWFAFCHADTGEVFIHFAREGGRYVVDGGPFGAAARGDDFAALVRELIGRHPLAAPRRQGSNVMLHPAALLIALVGACFFHAAQAKAAETAEGASARAAMEHARRTGITLAAGAAPVAAEGGPPVVVAMDAVQTATLLAAIAIGLREATPAASGGGAVAAPALGAISPLAEAQRAAAGAIHLDAAAIDHGTTGASALAVVAVLHDLFRLTTAASAPAAAAEAIGVSVAAAASPLPAASAPMTTGVTSGGPPGGTGAGGGPGGGGPGGGFGDAPMVVVHLGAGDLPHVEAVAIVQGLGLLQILSLDHVDRVDHLPSVLLNAIAQGEQVDLVHTDPPPPPQVDPQADHVPVQDGHALETAAVKGDGGAGGGAPSPPAEGSGSTAGAPAATTPVVLPAAHNDAAPPTVAVAAAATTASSSDAAPPAQAQAPGHDADQAAAAPLPPIVPTPPPSAVVTTDPGNIFVQADSSAVRAAVLKFTVDTHAGVLLVDGKVLIYDPHALDVLTPTEHLDAITFHFTDGSSISLVGTTASLHDLHGLH